MNNIPIVFTFDKRIILGAAAAIKSLINSAETAVYDIHILHSDIELNYQKHLTSLAEKTLHNISFHYIDPKIFNNVKKNKGSWSEIVYYRLIIPEVLRNYDKVIYSDVDVFFKKDLSDIFNRNIENHELMAVRAEKNTKNTIGHKYFKENKKDYIFWSGFLILNCKKLRQDNYFEKFIKNAHIYKEELKFFDLDLINITCPDIAPIPFEYCTLESIYELDDYKKAPEYEFLKDVYTKQEIEQAKKDPVIIHYAGFLGKPWRRKKVPSYYQKTINSLPKVLQKYTFRDIRKKIFARY